MKKIYKKPVCLLVRKNSAFAKPSINEANYD